MRPIPLRNALGATRPRQAITCCRARSPTWATSEPFLGRWFDPHSNNSVGLTVDLHHGGLQAADDADGSKLKRENS